jgi:RTX calcium-binding nonapeptide repeat (4 copies)
MGISQVRRGSGGRSSSGLDLRLVSRGAAALAVVAAVVLVAGAPSGATTTIRGTKGADLLRGTKSSDLIMGLQGADRLFGFRGNDYLQGGYGPDVLVGGPGRDVLSGGWGNDTARARDGARDTISCGRGRDTVHADARDSVARDCEIVRRPGAGPGAPPGQPPPPPSSGQTVVRVDQSWTCTGAVNLDLVKVTMRSRHEDAVYLRTNCSGRIGRLEIDTWTADGLKVNAPKPDAHDLTIWGGHIRCHDHAPGYHQDGVQVMGGQRITLRGVEINCNSEPNAQFFVAGAQGGLPTDVVCDGCLLGSGAAQTLFVSASLRSGARNTLVCAGRFRDVRVEGNARSPVLSGNTRLPAGDRRCTRP